MLAADNGDVELCSLLLQHGANPAFHGTLDDVTALRLACRHGHTTCVQLMLPLVDEEHHHVRASHCLPLVDIFY